MSPGSGASTLTRFWGFENYGEPPQRVAFDGGYASRANLADAKQLGVEHVVFHKKCGLAQTDMTPSAWIYGQLKRFRAGLEAGISYLKRCQSDRADRWDVDRVI